MKHCSKCDTTKPVEHFHRDRRKRDGRRLWCADCCKSYRRGRHVDPADLLAAIPAATGDPDWPRHGACRGHVGTFFVDHGRSVSAAREMCQRCPVQGDCLAAGISERYGVWGGRTERERRAIRRLLQIPEPAGVRS